MMPRLLPGRYVIVSYWFWPLREGDIVMIKHTGIEKIKRVAKVGKGKVFITGDNRMKSTDSRDFGWLDQSVVLAKLVWPRT